MRTSHPHGPTLRIVRPFDPEAEAAANDHEGFQVVKAALTMQGAAEQAGWADLARDARRVLQGCGDEPSSSTARAASAQGPRRSPSN